MGIHVTTKLAVAFQVAATYILQLAHSGSHPRKQNNAIKSN